MCTSGCFKMWYVRFLRPDWIKAQITWCDLIVGPALNSWFDWRPH